MELATVVDITARNRSIFSGITIATRPGIHHSCQIGGEARFKGLLGGETGFKELLGRESVSEALLDGEVLGLPRG